MPKKEKHLLDFKLCESVFQLSAFDGKTSTSVPSDLRQKSSDLIKSHVHTFALQTVGF